MALVSVASFAQDKASIKALRMQKAQISVSEKNNITRTIVRNSDNTTNTVVFEEQFDGGIPGTWENIDNVTGGTWQWTTVGTDDGTELSSTTAANGYAMYDSDGLGNDGEEEDADLITPSIDCSSLSTVILEFQHYFESGFGGEIWVQVSGDGGANWTTVLYNATTTTASNPTIFSENISSIAAGQSDVKVKFNWYGDYSWYWMFDDVVVYEPAVLQPDITFTKFRVSDYTAIPLQLATELVIKATIKNVGVADASNVVLNYEIKDFGNTSLDAGTSDPIATIAAGEEVEVEIMTGYTYNSTDINILNTIATLTLDETESNANNNTKEQKIFFGDSTYARDKTILTSTVNSLAGYTADASEILFGQIYELTHDDTLTSISAIVRPAGGGASPAANDTTRFVIYDYDDIDSIPNVEIGRSKLYTFATTVTAFRTINSQIDGGPMVLPAGKYFIGIREILGARAICLTTADSLYTPGQSLLRWTDGTWYDYAATGSAHALIIRPQFGNPCGRMAGTATATAADTNTTNTGAVSVTVTGGNTSTAYTYSWLNAGGDEVSTSATVSGLPAGVYTVTITDGIGCELVKTATVNSITTGIAKVAKANGVSVYPNPANNVINISASDIKATNISLINSVGQEVFSTSNANTTINVADFAEGSYIVKIRTENNVIIEKVNIVR